VIRLIRKWLKAGVSDEGQVAATESGTPQGAVISPLLANIYLHYVFDLWAHQWRRRHARGQVILVRYADDIVAGFEHKADAERFWADMKERMARFALTVHPDKTRPRIRSPGVGRFAAANRERRGEGKPETFDFLGFTHICGRNRRGGFLLRRKSRGDRMRAKLREIKEELRRHWHASIPEQGGWLKRVVGGWYNYHAVPTNIAALSSFRYLVGKLWLRALRRRSQKDRTNWAKMRSILDRWLPAPCILHPWSRARFAVKHPRWEPDALIGPVRFCAGGAQ
jgi:hypothetical protein